MVSTNASSNKGAQKPRYSNKPAGHVPRPLNSFMCFRAECCRNMPPGIDVEYRKGETLSITLSRAWKNLSDEQKQRWVDMAAEKKREHQKLYPDYKYRPGPRNPEKAKKAAAARRRRAREEGSRQEHTPEALSDQVGAHPAPSPSTSALAIPSSALEPYSAESDGSTSAALHASTSQQDPYVAYPGNTLELFNVDQPYPQLSVPVRHSPLPMLPSPYSMSEHSSPTESLLSLPPPLYRTMYSPLASPSALYSEPNVDKVLVFRGLLCDRCAAIHTLSFPANAHPNQHCHIRKISLCERCVSVNRREELKVMQRINARHVYSTAIQPPTLSYQMAPTELMNPGPSPAGTMPDQASPHSLDSLQSDQAADMPIMLDQYLNLDDQFNGPYEW